ncbi:MAG: hypothetical protein ACK5LK_03435 [Chthoniobacterales bacterium]
MFILFLTLAVVFLALYFSRFRKQINDRLNGQDVLIKNLRADYERLRTQSDKGEEAFSLSRESIIPEEKVAFKVGVKPALKKILPPPLPADRARDLPIEKTKAEVPRQTEPDSPRVTFRWRLLLEKIKLWPPSGETAEAAIAGWWLTRIGLMLFIISAVFFGVRMAENTPPWMRTTTLLGISFGMTAFGLWLEKRTRAFGRMISAGGLGLAYFTSFAAFALPATKVIADPVVAVAVQVGVLCLAFVWSLWKRDEGVAAMTIVLGYVSAWFSVHHDLQNFAMVGLLILGVGAAFLFAQKNWRWPMAFALVGSWGGFCLLGIVEWSATNAAVPTFSVLLGCLTILLCAFEGACLCSAKQLLGVEAMQNRERTLNRWLTLGNSSLGILASALVIQLTWPEQLKWLYLGFAILFIGFTTVRHLWTKDAGIVQTFFFKTSALIALYFVAEFDGPVRWLALSLQAGTVLWAYHRSRFRCLELAATLIFMAAFGSVLRDLFWESIDVNLVHLVVGGFSLSGLSAVLALHAVWTSHLVSVRPSWDWSWADFRAMGRCLLGVGVGLLAFYLVRQAECFELFMQNFSFILMAVALAAPAFVFKKFAPIAAASAVIIPAFFRCFDMAGEMSQTSPAILLTFVFGSVGLAASEMIWRGWRREWIFGHTARAIFSGLGLFAFFLGFYRWMEGCDFSAGVDMLMAAGFAIVAGLTLWRFSCPWSPEWAS